MKRVSLVLVFAAILAHSFALPTVAETITCTECGMMLEVGSKFTAKIVQEGKDLYFCDIGDLFAYLNRKKPQNVRIQVKDFPSGAWIDARSASYVRSAKKFNSPMGWGIAAFQDGNDAAAYGSALDFDAAMKAVL
jgi:nitrous oxide reductase accessory protein NosL